MNLSKIESLEKSNDRELLLMILSTQLQIARRIEILESKITNTDHGDVSQLCKDIVTKFDTFNERLNEQIIRKNHN
jgi:hypothetical protein